ncbi:MAG TPA: formate/nitrite transporter family protein [Acidimicrobiales bacterium]|nr:formate/nitrite transporter family protein [Acidimicrobiales bacterium]
MPDQLADVFDRTVSEGDRRLHRSWPELLATGAVGGIDISLGVFALLLVKQATGSEMASSLAFSIGFVCLTLANSELFTENFLVPVAALAAKRARWPALARLWFFTLLTNLAGGWLVMAIVMGGFPRLRPAAVEVGAHYAQQGIGWESLAGAILGGLIITLMTWMERSSEAITGKLAAAVVAGFLLAAGPLNHAIVVSLEMFAGSVAGAPYSYGQWFGVLLWASFGNVVGGIGLVTGLRLVQVGRREIEDQQDGGRGRGRGRRGGRGAAPKDAAGG